MTPEEGKKLKEEEKREKNKKFEENAKGIFFIIFVCVCILGFVWAGMQAYT